MYKVRVKLFFFFFFFLIPAYPCGRCRYKFQPSHHLQDVLKKFETKTPSCILLAFRAVCGTWSRAPSLPSAFLLAALPVM